MAIGKRGHSRCMCKIPIHHWVEVDCDQADGTVAVPAQNRDQPLRLVPVAYGSLWTRCDDEANGAEMVLPIQWRTSASAGHTETSMSAHSTTCENVRKMDGMIKANPSITINGVVEELVWNWT
ncbi:hypothetical protein TNCV_4803061 [Trichonephila clavipes]|nr:hypothetical protein TNCV_4803061 [Trichonephila clavipes]